MTIRKFTSGMCGELQEELRGKGELVREAAADVERLEEMHQQRLESLDDLSSHNRTLAGQMVLPAPGGLLNPKPSSALWVTHEIQSGTNVKGLVLVAWLAGCTEMSPACITFHAWDSKIIGSSFWDEQLENSLPVVLYRAAMLAYAL